MNCLGKFSPSTTEVCEPLRKLIFSKCKWTWNNTYNTYKTEPKLSSKRFQLWHSAFRTTVLETDTLGVQLGAIPLQPRDSMQSPRNEAPSSGALWSIEFLSKSLKSADTCYSNIERRALGILYGLEKFHHYGFVHKACDKRQCTTGSSF